MKTLVIYDSNYGNTKKVAEIVAEKIGAKVIKISQAKPEDLSGLDLVVFGSPILGWRPSEKTMAFMSKLKKGDVEGLKFATFDTRVRLFIHGDAAKKMTKDLEKLGGKMLTDPEYFYVAGTEGSLLAGEVEKAEKWGEKLKKFLDRENESF